MTRQTLLENIESQHGRAGRLWFDAIPQKLEIFARRWDLSLGDPFSNLTYHYVVPVESNQYGPSVLKYGLDLDNLRREGEALLHFSSDAVAKLYEADYSEGVLLIQRLLPGASLPEDEAECEIAAQLMRQFWKPCEEKSVFVPLKRWLSSLTAPTAVLPPTLKQHLMHAEAMSNQLLASASEHYLVHGDLHHENILLHQKQYKLIDPKGIIAERAYDLAVFILNPIGIGLRDNYHKITCNRIERFSNLLELDPVRILKWAYVQAVISLVWSYEDHGVEPDGAMHMVQVLHQMIEL